MTFTIENLPESMYEDLEYFAAKTRTSVRTAAVFLLLRAMSDDPVFNPATVESLQRELAARRA